MIRRLIFSILSIGSLFSQIQTDKPIEICGHLRSANKLFSSKSTITEEQEKIDITYYQINLEIDMTEQEIIGFVIINIIDNKTLTDFAFIFFATGYS